MFMRITSFNNRIPIYFYTMRNYTNAWIHNYWKKWLWIPPKPIPGKLLTKIGFIPWYNFDWHPAKEPYEIVC